MASVLAQALWRARPEAYVHSQTRVQFQFPETGRVQAVTCTAQREPQRNASLQKWEVCTPKGAFRNVEAGNLLGAGRGSTHATPRQGRALSRDGAQSSSGPTGSQWEQVGGLASCVSLIISLVGK